MSKRFKIQILDAEAGTDILVASGDGYSLLVLDEDGPDEFVASHMTDGLDLTQLAQLIDAMIEEEPRLQTLLDELADKRNDQTNKEDA